MTAHLLALQLLAGTPPRGPSATHEEHAIVAAPLAPPPSGNTVGPTRSTDLGLPPSPPSPRVQRFVRLPFEISSQLGLGGGLSVSNPFTPQSALQGLFSLSVRGDFIFGRTSVWSWGVGPFLSLRVDNFQRFGLNAGFSLLLPVSDTFPLLLSVGVASRTDLPRWGPGGLLRAWWGMRSLNFHSVYTVGVGLFAEGRFFLDDERHLDFVAGAELDLQFLAIPFLAFYSWAARRNPGR